jgi:hypothetical protein
MYPHPAQQFKKKRMRGGELKENDGRGEFN